MTVDIRVRRCRLTIRRGEGWSWGPEPRRHVDAALAQLDALLAGAAAEAGVPESAAIKIAAPVVLELGADGKATAASRAALVLRLRAAMTAQPPLPAPPIDEVLRAARVEAGKAAAAALPGAGAALARVLARWSRGGRMNAVVAAWPAAVLRAWTEASWAAASATTGSGASASALAPGAVAAIAEAVLGASSPEVAGGAAVVGAEASRERRLLILLAAIAAALGERLPDRATQAEARRLVAVAPPAVGAVARPVPAAASAPLGQSTIASPPAPADPAEIAARTRSRDATPVLPDVVPAVPFLVLAQLERIGYVDALVAAAAGAGLPGVAGLAAALAGKSLAPLGPGRYRTAAETAAVALASGLAPGDVGSALAALAEAAAPPALATPAPCDPPGGALVPPLSAALLAAYADGRSSQDEIVVTGLMCGEAEGLLPAAWVSSDEELVYALAALGDPPVRRAADFEPLMEALEARRALPIDDAPALERHLGAAVGTALGLLAADLWGPATPLLALERLGDLEAQVRVDGGRLLVAIPRGQRWLDLQRAGLLDDCELPWLGRMEVGTW